MRSPLELLCRSLFDRLDVAALQDIRLELAGQLIKPIAAFERDIVAAAIAELDGLVVSRMVKTLGEDRLFDLSPRRN